MVRSVVMGSGRIGARGSGFGVRGSGFGVWGSGFGVWGSGFGGRGGGGRVWGLWGRGSGNGSSTTSCRPLRDLSPAPRTPNPEPRTPNPDSSRIQKRSGVAEDLSYARLLTGLRIPDPGSRL